MKEKNTNLRFYPDFYPSFEGEPTRDKFEIMTTISNGEGLVSLTSFKENGVVFRFAGLLLDEITLFTLQLQPGKHLHDPFCMGKVLHSCDPNMRCDMETRTFTAVKDINPGDFLTMDYDTTEDILFRPFECSCGSENCRGFVSGKKASIGQYPCAV